MTKIVFLFFTFILEALIVYSYAKSIYSVKKNATISFSVAILLYILLCVIYSYVYNNEIFNIFIIIIVNILIVFLLFNSSLKSAIFHGFALGISQLLAEFITLHLLAGILQTQSQTIVSEHFEVGTILSRSIYFLLTRLLILLSCKENKSRSWGKWFALSLLPLSSILIIISFRLITNDLLLNQRNNVLLIISISFLLFVNIVVYMIYEQAEKSNQKLLELEMVTQKNDIDLQYLSLLEKKNETMQIMSHDYKRHIMTIDAMTDSPEIKAYIQDMLGDIGQYNQIGKTKNKLLDVIFSKYTDICREKGIHLKMDVVSDNLCFLNNADLSALFNNLLDNAVEAAEQSTEKCIEIQIAGSMNAYHKVKITNSCDSPPTVKSGNLITTKHNQDIHGFGIKSIRKIVKKYHGEMQWEYIEPAKQFQSILVFPIEQQS